MQTKKNQGFQKLNYNKTYYWMDPSKENVETIRTVKFFSHSRVTTKSKLFRRKCGKIKDNKQKKCFLLLNVLKSSDKNSFKKVN